LDRFNRRLRGWRGFNLILKPVGLASL
jgi:hypothetical protein